MIGNLKFKAYFELLYPLKLVDSLRPSKLHHCFVLGYHWLPLATIDLVGDNREFEAFRHILSCYTHYSWLIVLDLESIITVCPWLSLVAPSNH